MTDISRLYRKAVIKSDVEWLEKILDSSSADIDIDQKIENKFTALHLAVTNVNICMIKLLLKHGADVNARDEFGNTCFHRAIYTNKLNIVKMFINANNPNGNGKQTSSVVEINTQNQLGNTPLHGAVMRRNYQLVKLMLQRGADPNQTNNANYSPFHLSFSYYNNAKMIDVILKHGADVTLKNMNGENALHLAVAHQKLEVLEKILQMNVDVNALNYLGETALHLAIIKTFSSLDVQLKVVSLLIERGADINVTNTFEKTTLQCAIQNFGAPTCQLKKIKICNYLLRHVALLSVQRLHVHNSDMELIESNDRILMRYLVFHEELIRMKRTKIHKDVDTTYYDILTKRGKSIVLYLRNENTNSTLKLKKYKKLFPCYAGDLESHHLNGLQELKKRDKFIEVLRETVGRYLNNDDIICTLSEYYNDKDFLICCGHLTEL